MVLEMFEEKMAAISCILELNNFSNSEYTCCQGCLPSSFCSIKHMVPEISFEEFQDGCHGALLDIKQQLNLQPLKNRQNKDLYDKWYLNEGQKYCRMLPLEHSAILLTCIKL